MRLFGGFVRGFAGFQVVFDFSLFLILLCLSLRNLATPLSPKSPKPTHNTSPTNLSQNPKIAHFLPFVPHFSRF